MTAKIKLNAASGGGSFSLQAPSSSSNNRVFTLPDSADATLLTSTSNVGKILKVESTTITVTSSFSSSSTNTFVDLSGLTVSITPTAASSKIFIAFTAAVAVGSGTAHIRLVRGSTAIAVGDSASSRLQSTVARRSQSSVYALECTPMSFSFLDTPTYNLGDSLTYKLQGTAGSSYNTTYYVNRSSGDTDADYGSRVASSITVMEVGA